ncbi:MAG: hypothetical protein JNL41_17945 [Phenylobacterium sp.]|uniref:hypothetical protein n=1 Tax=Phenylobacterium sp. TaxID=1871053 RepID=UPI001A512A6E|nr:hypothetical protein [Phenylobacterium sp.]MBL8556164.1 hypothetical protein [Phenylobacterium sp.]
MSPVRRRRLSGGQKLAIAGFALVFLGFAAWLYGGSYLRQRDFALGRAREAAVEGPPCPEITRAQFEAQRLRKFKTTLYEGVVFGRQFGHMDCSILRYGGGWSPQSYPVCQFTGPGLLSVKTARGEWFYAPGVGKPASVGAPHGEARCVMASNFTVQKLIAR